MSITPKDLKAIKGDLAKRRPTQLATDGSRTMSTKEIIVALAPELNKMKSRGFTTQEVVDALAAHQINIKGATLNRYLNELKQSVPKGPDKTEPIIPSVSSSSNSGY